MDSDEARQRQRTIAEEMAAMGFCLPGSVVTRTNRCGNPRCSCQDDPDRRHGPYRLWTRKVAGKTVTRTLSEAQLERYQPWFDNQRRMRELLGELEQLSVATMATEQAWPEPPTAPPDRRRSRSPRGRMPDSGR